MGSTLSGQLWYYQFLILLKKEQSKWLFSNFQSKWVSKIIHSPFKATISERKKNGRSINWEMKRIPNKEQLSPKKNDKQAQSSDFNCSIAFQRLAWKYWQFSWSIPEIYFDMTKSSKNPSKDFCFWWEILRSSFWPLIGSPIFNSSVFSLFLCPSGRVGSTCNPPFSRFNPGGLRHLQFPWGIGGSWD